MLRGWVTGKKAQADGSSQALTAEREVEYLNEAMAAVMRIMNDDIEGAEAGVKSGDSSFHKLGLGLINFLRAALGFEKEAIKEAQESLWAAEADALSDLKRVKKDAGAFKSEIYEHGSEFTLSHSQCLLMGALAGIISESVTEALKGLYNMRKAYMALEAISQAETKYLERRKAASAVSTPFTALSAATTQPNSKTPSLRGENASGDPTVTEKEPGATKNSKADSNAGSDDEDETFTDAPEDNEDLATPMQHQGKVKLQEITEELGAVDLRRDERPSETKENVAGDAKELQTTYTVPEDDDFVHPIDVYVHSGISLCFGLLLMMLSMIPPAFGRILSIIGFRGDRDRGLRMLWQASKFDNLNGALSCLVLFAWYNGPISFCDIIPEADPKAPDDAIQNITGYPLHRLQKLLAKMRRQFPKSSLWQLEEARMLAADRRTAESLPLLNSDFTSPLKQINALAIFERALQHMYRHEHRECASSFLESIKLNSWSHALCFYIAGASHVELYRQAITAGDKDSAETESKKAAEYFAEVHAHAGKRRFMAKQLPFEAFCLRKLAKWEERAKEYDVSLVEAVGVSPMEEMLYFWNGYKKMDDQMLEDSLKTLAWTEDASHSPNWEKYGEDEHGAQALLRAVTLRSLRKYDESRTILLDVINRDRALFKGGNKDDYPQPVAHYEMSVLMWHERTHNGKPREEGSEEDIKNVKEAQDWLEKARTWETYTLDARIGLKIASGVETLKTWLAIYDKKE